MPVYCIKSCRAQPL